MNTHSGATYQIRELEDGTKAGRVDFTSHLAELERRHGELTEAEHYAKEAIAAGHEVVPVSETVVQKLRLGERELARRARRRRRQMKGIAGT